MGKAHANQMVMELRPLDGGSYTQLSLRGPVCSAPQTRELLRLLRMFSHWNGYPVRVVLSVEGLKAPWLDVWCDALATVPARHCEMKFRAVARPAVRESERR